MNTLPADLLRSIAGELNGKNAARLATVSTAFHAVIKETHPTLPAGPSKYVAGTGKFQKEYKTLLKRLAKQENTVDQTRKIMIACFVGDYAFREARKALKNHTLVHLVSVEWQKRFQTPNLRPLVKEIRKALKSLRYTTVLDDMKKRKAPRDETLGDRMMDAVIQGISKYASLK